jgi:hypothetical protein
MLAKIDAQALSKSSQKGLISYDCPCICCHGVKRQLCNSIKKHLRKYGCDPYFQMPMVV